MFPSNDAFTPANFGASSNQGMAITASVSGTGCPVALSFNISTTTQSSAQSVTAHVDMSYSVSDATFKTLNDVTGFTAKGDISMSMGNSPSASGGLSGTITSQQYGSIPFAMAVSASGDSATVEMTAQFQGFNWDLKVTQSSNAQPVYTLNGQTISASDAQALFTQISAVGGTGN